MYSLGVSGSLRISSECFTCISAHFSLGAHLIAVEVVNMSTLPTWLPSLRTLRIQPEGKDRLNTSALGYSFWLPTLLSHFKSSTSPYLTTIRLYFSVTRDVLLELKDQSDLQISLDLDALWARADESLTTLPLELLSIYLTAPEDDIKQATTLLGKRLPILHATLSTKIHISKPTPSSQNRRRYALIHRKVGEMD